MPPPVEKLPLPIENEWGEGGMANGVYLADDLEHERKAALKVLKPDSTVVVGAYGFLAEIKTTAESDRAPSRIPGTYPSWPGGRSSS